MVLGETTENKKMRVSSSLLFLFQTFLLYEFVSSSPSWLAESDIENVEVTIDKKSDFHYESVIIIRFKDKGLVKEDTQLYNPENYLLYPKRSFQRGKLLRYFHPERIARSETVPEIYLYVSLQPKTEYVLKVKDNTIAYENNELIKCGIIDRIKLDEKYHKFMKSTPVFDIDISPAYKINDLIFDIDFFGVLFSKEKTMLSGVFDGNFSLEEISSFNSVILSLQLKRNLSNEGYFPVNCSIGFESSQDLSVKNVVGAVKIEFLIPIPEWLRFSLTQFSPFPVVKFGYGYAQSIGTDENMNRINGDFVWKIPIKDRFVLDNTINIVFDIRNPDSVYSFREHALYYRITKSLNVMVLKFMEGKKPPLFKYQRDVLTGISLDLF